MLLLKLCLGFVLAAGLGSSIGVPLAMNSGRGGQSRIGKVSLEKCSSEYHIDSELVSFGDNSKSSVCWSLDNEEQHGTLPSSSKEYTKFLQDHWGKNERIWASDLDRWTKECLGEGLHPQWKITIQDSKNHYLGLCGGSDLKNTMFIKKKEGDSDHASQPTLWMCESQCWDEGNEQIAITKAYTKEKDNSWKQVAFYDNTGKNASES